jgi:hypothetical protein
MTHINPFEDPDLLRDRLIRYDFDRQILLDCRERHKNKKEFTEGILIGLTFGIMGNFFVSFILEFLKTPNSAYGAGSIVMLILIVLILFVFDKHRKKEIGDIKKYDATINELNEYVTEGKRHLSSLKKHKM